MAPERISCSLRILRRQFVPMTERRKLPRMLTTVRVDALDGGPPLIAHDLSLGGMLLTAHTPRWPGTLMRVRFRLPGSQRAICATCRVVELVDVPVGVGLAVRFLRLAPEAQAAILRYMDTRPLPSLDDLDIAAKIDAWVQRIAEDCQQLRAIAG
jgi:hypothetical protein